MEIMPDRNTNFLDFAKMTSDHYEGFDLMFQKINEKAKVLANCPFVEIGTRAGGSAILFLNAIKNTSNFLITIDPYGKSYLADGEWPPIGEDMYRSANFHIANFCQCFEVLHVPYRMTSKDFFKTWETTNLWIEGKTCTSPFGVVYLDGEHTEEMVTKELLWFIPKMHANGLMIIDDISYLKDTKDPFLQTVLQIGETDSNRLYISIIKLKQCVVK